MLLALCTIGVGISVCVDSKNGEVFILETLNQRFFVGDFTLAWASPKTPKDDIGHFTFIVR